MKFLEQFIDESYERRSRSQYAIKRTLITVQCAHCCVHLP